VVSSQQVADVVAWVIACLKAALSFGAVMLVAAALDE
jgi:hypothetical protein